MSANRSLEEDRKEEFVSFFGPDAPLEIPASDYSRDLTPLDDEALFAHLESTSRSGLLRNLLRSSRLPEAAALVGALGRRFPARDRASVRVLDYGCGVADHALVFALAGFSAAIADIPSKARFAASRFHSRSLPVEVIEIDAANWKSPPLGSRDIVICGEVLEHVRYPLETARAFGNCLPPGGWLWVSSYPFREKKRGGTHLEEAYHARPQVARALRRAYRRVREEGLPGYLLQRRRAGLLGLIFG